MGVPEPGTTLEFRLPLESVAKTQALLEHSATGCFECGEVLRLLQEAEARGQGLSRSEPPEYAVESVKERFGSGVARRSCKKVEDGYIKITTESL